MFKCIFHCENNHLNMNFSSCFKNLKKERLFTYVIKTSGIYFTRKWILTQRYIQNYQLKFPKLDMDTSILQKRQLLVKYRLLLPSKIYLASHECKKQRIRHAFVPNFSTNLSRENRFFSLLRWEIPRLEICLLKLCATTVLENRLNSSRAGKSREGS